MKSRNYIILLFFFSLFATEAVAVDSYKDAFFREKVASLEEKLVDDESYVYLHDYDDMKFMEVLSYISDRIFFEFQYNNCCNPRYRKEHVDCLKEWYRDNKERILDRIERVYDLVEILIPYTVTFEEKLMYIDELDSISYDPIRVNPIDSLR